MGRATASRAVRQGHEDGPIIAMVAELAARTAVLAGEPDVAAALLGIATTRRGALDLGNPDVVATVAAVRATLGSVRADEAIRRGRDLSQPEGEALLARCCTSPCGRDA